MELKVKIVRDGFKEEDVLPKYQTKGSGGMDLKAALEKEIILKPGERKLVPTGIAISFQEEEMVALIYPRSGLATKKGIALANGVGVVDSDYRGEIFCPLINLSQENFVLEPLTRIAQLVLTPIVVCDLKVVTELEETDRGTNGFGSTGR